jgi:hypothetical protein
LEAVAEARPDIRRQVEDIRLVAEALDPETGRVAQRRKRFAALRERFASGASAFHRHVSRRMGSFAPGRFVGGDAADVSWDNLDLERWFRLPQGHERRIHGRRHAGIRIGCEGPTRLLVLDAHRGRDGPFPAEELHPYRHHPAPADQEATRHRHRVMRRARSPKQRRALLQELEQRYLDGS